jgi:hypothetical protein
MTYVQVTTKCHARHQFVVVSVIYWLSIVLVPAKMATAIRALSSISGFFTSLSIWFKLLDGEQVKHSLAFEARTPARSPTSNIWSFPLGSWPWHAEEPPDCRSAMKELIHQYGAWIVLALVFLESIGLLLPRKRS